MTSRQPMAIAIDVSAIPVRLAGAGRYVVELAQALHARDDVELSLLTRRDDQARWSHSAARTLAIAPAHLASRLLFGEFLLGAAMRRGIRPEVLHGPHYTLPTRAGVPSVVTVHDLTLIEHPEWHEPSKVVFFRRALRLASRRADVVVVPSEFVASAYRRHFGERVPVRVIPHGVDRGRFRPEETTPGSDEAVLERLRIDWPFIVNVAILEPRKNLPALVRAYARLVPRNPELRLVLTGGSGWKGDELEAAIAASGVANKIVRLGYVDNDDVPALLRRAAVVAYPSFEEGFGLPALEALACGAALVTTSDSAMAEVAGDAALLVSPSDADALTDALAEALAGGLESRNRRARGVARSKDFTWEASAFSHLEAYALAARTHTAQSSRSA